MRRRPATLQDLKDNYGKILYQATDGLYYRLWKYYPLKFDVEDRPDTLALDTGGPMGTCDFGVFKVEEGKLMREKDFTKEFKQVSPSIIIEEE